MDAMDESLMEEDHQPAKDEGKDTWPFPPEDDSREVELFLMDIGLRL